MDSSTRVSTVLTLIAIAAGAVAFVVPGMTELWVLLAVLPLLGAAWYGLHMDREVIAMRQRWRERNLVPIRGTVAASSFPPLAAEPEPPLYRATMELGEIACHVAGKPVVAQITSGDELALFKVLRDAANEGRLAMVDPNQRGDYDEHSPTTAQNLLEFVEQQEDGARFRGFAGNWRDKTPKRHFRLKVEPGTFRLTGSEIQAAVASVPLTRQISIGEVRLQNFVGKERRLSIFVKGHNASPHRLLMNDPSGHIGVDDAERHRIDNTGRPALRHFLPETRAGRPAIPGAPPGDGFEAVVEARMSDSLADRIESEFAAGRPINLDLTNLELCVFPHDQLETQVRLSLPSSIHAKRVDGGFYSTQNIVLGAPRIEGTSAPHSPSVRRN